MIHENLKKELTEALKSRDTVRLSVIRDLISSFTNELITLGERPEGVLDDENALKVIRRKANQRKDSIEQFEKGGRPELAEKEAIELEILESYLPAQMPDEEILKIINAKKAELGISEKKDMGKLIGAAMQEIGSRADGARVQKIVNEALG